MQDLRKLLSETRNKKLLAVFPHPDDETLPIGGLLLTVANLGFETTVLTLTKGERGEVHVPMHGRSTSDIRAKELQEAATLLKIGKVIQEDFGDGSMRASKEKWSKWLTAQIKEHDPGIVITYDHSGITGHPDHIVLSVELYRLISAMPAAKRPLLLWPTLGKKLRNRLAHKVARKYLTYPEYRLPLGLNLVTKFRAGQAHASQMSHVIWKMLVLLLLDPYEYYSVASFDTAYKHAFVEFDLGEAVKKL